MNYNFLYFIQLFLIFAAVLGVHFFIAKKRRVKLELILKCISFSEQFIEKMADRIINRCDLNAFDKYEIWRYFLHKKSVLLISNNENKRRTTDYGAYIRGI